MGQDPHQAQDPTSPAAFVASPVLDADPAVVLARTLRDTHPATIVARAVADANPAAIAAQIARDANPVLTIAQTLRDANPAAILAETLRETSPAAIVAQALREAPNPVLPFASAMNELTQPWSILERALGQAARDLSSGLRVALSEFDSYAWAAVMASVQTIVEHEGVEPELAEPFEKLDAQIDNSRTPLSRTLAALPLHAQVAMFMALMAVIDRAGNFGSELTGVDVPPAVRAATELMFATAGFLILWMQAKQPPEE
jgi:hypothetical protein